MHDPCLVRTFGGTNHYHLMTLKHLLSNSMTLLETKIGNTHPLLNCSLLAKIQVRVWCMHQTIEKKGVLQLALQLNFWVAMTTCNSLYFYVVSTTDKLHELQKLQFIVCMVQLIATQLQFSCNSITTIHFQLQCNSPMITTIMSC